MSWLRFGTTALGLSVLLLSVVLTGCGGGKSRDDDADDNAPVRSTRTKTKPGTPKAAGGPEVKGTAVKAGTGTLTGKVTLVGDKPDKDLKEETEKLQKAMRDKPTERPYCLDSVKPDDKAQTEEQDWIIGDGNGVKDVVVFLRPAPGTYFACDEKDSGVKAHKDEKVKIDQPHCAFLPHALVLFPSYTDADGKKQSTGQKLIVTNHSKTGHNFAYTDYGGVNPGGNISLGPDSEKELDPLEPSKDPVSISCKVHTWMSGDMWAVDHPYYAVTDKDGKFEIKNVPAGNVNIAAWHGRAKWLNPGRYKGDPIELTDKGGEKNFEIQYKK
jgi:hypothetical protein